MSKQLGGYLTMMEDWWDIQALCMEPMDTFEVKTWDAIIDCHRAGRYEEMMRLVAAFNAYQAEVVL